MAKSKSKKLFPPKKGKSARFGGRTAGGGPTELDSAATARTSGGRKAKPNKNRG